MQLTSISENSFLKTLKRLLTSNMRNLSRSESVPFQR